ncbi:MAG TPA: helix-turn-helix transcriptional regulator [Rubrobacteraceae bacterium]|nr:helix-turn-helix transcriptional regulator [Rubrobacteraceae bacterium]
MRGQEIGERLVNIRRLRMWTQGRLAREAGVSPTTVSGIETGKIARPHFGTLQKLARALDVDPQLLLLSEDPLNQEGPEFLSLQWARAVEEEEFERELEGASLDQLRSLARELKDEGERLQRLYGEFPEGSEQRRFIKRQIRDISAQSGSITTSMMFHVHEDAKERTDNRQKDTAGELRREGGV